MNFGVFKSNIYPIMENVKSHNSITINDRAKDLITKMFLIGDFICDTNTFNMDISSG